MTVSWLGEAPATAHWWEDFADPRADFRRKGVTAVQLLDRTSADAYAERLIAAFKTDGTRAVVDETAPRLGTDGTACRSWTLDRDALTACAPELVGLYPAVRLIAETVVGRPVIMSPRYDSSVYAKAYEAGDSLHWHVDSNPLTGLLVLRGPGPTITGHVDPAYPIGSLLVFDGRRYAHCVKPWRQEGWRITVPYNLYYPGDTWRPAGLDALIFGATPAPAPRPQHYSVSYGS